MALYGMYEVTLLAVVNLTLVLIWVILSKFGE